MTGNIPRVQQAFLVSIADIAEADGLIRFFGRSSGALTVKARGIRKPTAKLGPRLKQADELEIRLAGQGSTPLLSGVSTSFDHQAWRSGLDRLALAWFMVESAWIASGDEEDNQQMFRLIASILRAGPSPTGLTPAATTFCLKFLKLLGTQPDLDYCVVDGHQLESAEPVHLAPSCEGLVGRAGYNSRYGTSANTLAAFEATDIANWRLITDARLADCLRLECSLNCAALAIRCCVQLVNQACGQSPRSAEFLRQQWKIPSPGDH